MNKYIAAAIIACCGASAQAQTTTHVMPAGTVFDVTVTSASGVPMLTMNIFAATTANGTCGASTSNYAILPATDPEFGSVVSAFLAMRKQGRQTTVVVSPYPADPLKCVINSIRFD